mgnify:CR=1 FL=1
MAKISRRNFMRGAAMGTMGAAAAGLLTACGNTASSTTSAPASSAASSEAASAVTKPSSPVDGKYVTKAMGHESWVHVATTFFEGKITACEVLSHEETIGIGNYACSRIPAAIVEHQSINVPNLRGSSITSMAVKAAVKEAIELAGYNVDDFSKEVTLETVFLEKYDRYAARFTREPSGPSAVLESGFYKVEYNDNAAFKSKLEDGYAMEVLLRRYDDPQKLQIKPFASSEGGGVSICFWADDSNQIVMETGTKNATGGNVWKTAKSGVTPLKDVYYHIVAVWDKAAGTQKIYVDGELKATNNSAGGEFRHMNTNVDKRWFGIGADPNPNDKGQISFNGEVVIARIYDDPINADQVHALWKLVK